MQSRRSRGIRAGAGGLVLALAACGRVGFDPRGLGADAALDGDASVPIDGGGLPPFGAAEPVSELDGAAAVDDPSLTADQLEIVFEAEEDLYTATRASEADPWEMPVRIDELSGAGRDATPEISADGLTLFFTRGSQSFANVYVATRSSRSDPWGTPAQVEELSSSSGEVSPTPSADLESITLGSRRTGTLGDYDLYLATRPSPTDAWGTPEPIDALNTPALDGAPMLSRGGTVIYFASEREGSDGRDLYRAERADAASPFGAPAPVSELNTAGNDADPWVSEDERTIYFARDGQIYRASR